MQPAAEAHAPERTRPDQLEVAVLGERAREWVGAIAREVAPEAGGLSLLLVDESPGVARSEVERAVDAARAAGARVVGLSRGAPEPAWAGLEDVRMGAAEAGESPAVPACAPVDPAVFNPLGFRQTDVAGFCALAGQAARPEGIVEALPTLARAAGNEPVSLLCAYESAPAAPPAGVLPTTPSTFDTAELLQSIHPRLGAIDHPGLHAAEWERASLLVRLCAAGVPVAAEEITPGLRHLLGEELSEALSHTSLRELADLNLRERASVALRRAALRNHSLEARWRAVAGVLGLPVPSPRRVSVILSTRRESWLEHGLEQAERQNYEPRELLVCLHGDEFSEGVEGRIRERCSGEVRVLHVDSALTLGEALNMGVEAATGDYVTKMDDDDYYSVDHLWDLVLALEYSGADLAGKAAEFVYLEEIDVTIRQLTKDVETRLAGGGMMIRREPLRELGGWPSLTRGEDLAIVRRFVEGNRRVHRTQPHGYILNRHGRDHTWRPYVDYFLFRSERQWRGLRFDQTGID